jgi:hypothetical protein
MISITRGDSRTLLATVYTTEAMTTPQSLATATAIRFTARRTSSAGTQVLQKTLAGGTVRITNAAAGQLEIDLAPADTSALPASVSRLVYDLEITWPGPQVTTVDLGTLEVQPDVSY